MEKDFVVSELLAQGAAYTVMGICIVFLILIIIMFVIKAMALFSKEPAAAEVPAQAPAAVEVADETDDLELVAVITAAIAASMGTSASSIIVKSYKKVGAWNKAGRREVLENRF